VIFIPAIDLKNNKCVRLIRGKEEEQTIFNNNPVEQAIFFEESGCERLHVVDLDGAFGRSNINKDTILKIRKETNIPIELGGGIKNKEDVSFWLNKGIDFLVVGSLAVKKSNLILDLVSQFNNQIYVALDVLRGSIMIKGWTESSEFTINDIFEVYDTSQIKGYILTDISRDGMLQGLDMNLINKHVAMTKKNLIVGGGLSHYEDLRNLNKIPYTNLEGVIAGKSYYSGAIEIDKALNILKSNA
jgi:phosphoribosylformimino-5-aminoimidazole carboxamide ribotide isomerase